VWPPSHFRDLEEILPIADKRPVYPDKRRTLAGVVGLLDRRTEILEPPAIQEEPHRVPVQREVLLRRLRVRGESRAHSRQQLLEPCIGQPPVRIRTRWVVDSEAADLVDHLEGLAQCLPFRLPPLGKKGVGVCEP
jgi:hypothetical protein